MAKEQEVIGNVYKRVIINVFFLRISGYHRTTCTIYSQIILYEEIELEKQQYNNLSHIPLEVSYTPVSGHDFFLCCDYSVVLWFLYVSISTFVSPASGYKRDQEERQLYTLYIIQK